MRASNKPGAIQPRTFRSFPSWQAQITLEAFHEVWECVSVHREAFKAAKTAAGF